MTKLLVLADVKGLGEVVESDKYFYIALQELKSGRARLITPREEAYARLNTKGSIGGSDGTWTTAGFEYAKEQSPILNLNSRLTDPSLAKLATEANREGNYFSTESIREYEQSLKQAEKDKNKEPAKRNTIVLPSRNEFRITDKENWEVLETVLKDQAKPYFEFNGPIVVYPVPPETIDTQEGTLLTQLWFGSLDDRSYFSGVSRNLDYGNWVRGVRDSAEGTVLI
ncbi:MAG: hypothetical protein AABY07_07885 [Nanoarchaeota archaeon]